MTARIDEDEAWAHLACSGSANGEKSWRPDHGDVFAAGGLRVAETRSASVAPHIARHDPARALREVAAKRRLIGRYRAALAARAADDDPPDYDPALGALYGQMCDEATVWSDHPDYRAEWA